jgi:hypothetical protein
MSDWLIVRPAVPGDADALVELGLEVAGEPELWLTYDRTRGDERRNVRGVQRDAERGRAGRGDGRASSVACRSRATAARPAATWPSSLMVAARARRQGIGALIEEAMKGARGLESSSSS